MRIVVRCARELMCKVTWRLAEYPDTLCVTGLQQSACARCCQTVMRNDT